MARKLKKPKPAPRVASKARRRAEATVAASAPAVQDDRVWGGEVDLKDATGVPTKVTTKTEYWDVLRKHGLRMEEQQESTTGVGEKGEAFKAPALDPVVEVAPMGQEEAHLFGAVGAIYARHGLREALTCGHCFVRSRPSGIDLTVTNRRVRIRCRCGTTEYVTPQGTTDLVLQTLATTSITQNDRAIGTVTTDVGQINVPTFILHDMEALIIRRYMGALHARNIEPHLFHAGSGAGQGCWSGRARAFEEEVGLKVTRNEIVVTCPCRTLFWRGAKVAPGIIH